MTGPLAGIRVVEMAGIGPGPLVGMMLSDLGGDVFRVVCPGAPQEAQTHVLRGRRTVLADLKDRDDLAHVRALLDAADVLLEGFRPGVMERLGLGPEPCMERNQRLVFGRVTGWGQDGPLATTAGHDINYISLTGALHAVGPADQPYPPLNLVGDFGGGTLFLVAGILAALFERERSGQGQVVDAAMVDGVGVLAQSLLELRATGRWDDERHHNILDGAAPYYRTYRCSDGLFVAVGSIEPKFYVLLLAGLGLDSEDLPHQEERLHWPDLSKLFESVFVKQPRSHWLERFDGTDACVTPVLTFEESPDHPHVAARGALRRGGGHVTSGPAPRLSRSALREQPEVSGGVALSAAPESWVA